MIELPEAVTIATQLSKTITSPARIAEHRSRRSVILAVPVIFALRVRCKSSEINTKIEIAAA